MALGFLAGVGVAEVFDGDRLMLRSKTLTDEGWSLSVTPNELRAGGGNQLVGRFFTDSNLTVTLTDVIWQMQYVSWQTGSVVTTDTDYASLITEEVTVSVANQITVSQTPQEWMGLGTIGWYKPTGSDHFVSDAITFTGNTATVSGLSVGDKVCVRYNAKGNIDQIVIPSEFIPSVVTLHMTVPLWAAASANDTDIANATKIGSVEILVPRYSFDGSMEFAVSSSSNATSNLSGTALAVLNGEGCEDGGYYAIIKEVHLNGNWYDGLTALAVDNADRTMGKGQTAILSVYGKYNDGRFGHIGNDKLTFSSTGGTGISVGASTGVITTTSSATGSADIEITVTDKPSVTGFARVTIE